VVIALQRAIETCTGEARCVMGFPITETLAMKMQLADLAALPEPTLSALATGLGEPVLVTHGDEPRLVLQPIESFEAMVRRLRILEARVALTENDMPTRSRSNVVPFRRR